MRHLAQVLLSLVLSCSLTGCQSPSGQLSQPPVADGSLLSVHYIDVGQADATLLICGDDTMLIDGGNVDDSSLVVSYLGQQGVEHLDYMLCTHAHEDHVGGLSGPLNTCTVEHVYSPVTEYSSNAFNNFVKYTKAQGKEVEQPTVGDSFSLGDAIVTILGPVKDYTDTNNTSIVLRVDFGETAFLFTGDQERTAEADLLESGADLDATVLKVGHHGSSTSTSYPFLRAVMPTYAVIPVGTGNSYGHPSDDVLSRLRDADVTVYRTDLQGTVVATSDGKTVSFQTGKESTGQGNTSVQTQYYIGNTRSKVFHREDCSSLPGEQNQILFTSRPEAKNSGYTPCGICKP